MTANAGKGKVTPVQIAFIVDRYLADHGYKATLASFRSECQLPFSASRNKELPKGLLSLAEILDDYVMIKGQRIILDQEKQRVDALIRGMQDAVQAYHSAAVDGGNPRTSYLPHSISPLPSTPLPLPPPTESSAVPIISGHLSSSFALSSTAGHLAQHSVSTPAAHASSVSKSKGSKTSTSVPSAPKKYRPRSNSVASAAKEESSNSVPPAGSASPSSQRNVPSIQSSSVAKILFTKEADETQPVAVQDSHESAPSKKSTTENLANRVNGKERLESDGSEEVERTDDIFDLDIQYLDLDFSDILCNLDFDCGDPAKPSVDSAREPEVEPGQCRPEAVDHNGRLDLKSENSDDPEDTGDDGGAVTATRGITKRIRLSSP